QGNAFLVKLFRNIQRTVAADDNERFEAEPAEVLNNSARNVALHDASAFAEDGITEGVGGIRRPENGAAEMKDSGHIRRAHREGIILNEAIEAFFNSENIPAEADRSFDGSADNGIQCRTVSAACQDSDAHRLYLRHLCSLGPVLDSRIRRQARAGLNTPQ